MKDFKVRCVSDDGSGAFTAGNIYEFKDGKSVTNMGCAICYGSVEDLNRNYHSQFELVEEEKMFTKDDLKVNDWCVQRNGKVYRIASLDSALYMVGEHDFRGTGGLSNNLTDNYENEFDILKIYRPKVQYGYQLIRKDYKDGIVVFDREKGIGCEPPVKEISVDEATKLLTEKFGQNVRIRVGK